ncbi:MAG: hypothetical protein DMD79_02545 [Candidatus Rokuibacteriota bacterium]|jgi:hypothetical protein|nr:MAG: hypothetical protein DMD79_02545 [Candidatus Rokubacteria bacterium]
MADQFLRVEFERGGSFRARLLKGEAPETTALVRKLLPMTTLAKQTRLDGMTLFFTTEQRGVVENPVPELKPGQFRFCPDGQYAGYFVLTYGDRLHSPRPFNLFAVIEDDLEQLRQVGDRIWLKGAENITVRAD